MMSLAERSWFPLADLACVVMAATLLVIFPQMGGWPILLALIPWAVRIAGGHLPFARTRFDIPLLAIMATGAIGIWVAPQPPAAWEKFWLLAISVLLYFAVASQPQKNIWLVFGLISLIALASTILFLLTADWEVQPSKINLFNQWMSGWMRMRPEIHLAAPYHDEVAGLAAIAAPFAIAISIKAWQDRRFLLALFAITTCVLLGFVLVITTVRGAWIALVITLAVLVFWRLGKALVTIIRLPQRIFVQLAIVAFGAMAVITFLATPTLLTRIETLLPAPLGATNRLVLANNAWQLIFDYPFTGGGLAGFPGQYSQYILAIPYFFFRDSHNLFLDVAVEQGILGLIALAWIFLGTLFSLVGAQRTEDGSVPRWALLSGLLVLPLYGLSNDSIYASHYLPLLFVIPGMAVAYTRSEAAGKNSVWRGWMLPAAVTSVLAFSIAVIFQHPLASVWYANLGAVRMAQVELSDFPSGRWGEGQRLAALAPAEELFQRALREDGSNSTANYRLGLIALQRRDFSAATAYLEKASRLEPQHPGIQKNLGYSYAWSGQVRSAAALLRSMPGAYDEIESYRLWWHLQGRDDLAQVAGLLASDLAVTR